MLYPTLLLLTTVTGVTGGLGSPLVPAVAERAHVALSTAQWIVTGPLLFGAVASPVVGRLGSGRRRRPVLLVVLGAATLGTFIAALPWGIGGLIAGRTISGLAFAVAPLVFAIARDTLPPATMRSRLGTLSVANVAATGLGYPCTTSVVHAAGLAAAFWSGAALMAAALVLAVVAVPPSAQPPTRGADLVGAGLLVSGILALLLVISQGTAWDYASPAVVCLAVASVVLLGLAVRHFRRTPFPLVDLALATSRGVLGLHVTVVLIGWGAYVLLSTAMVLAQSDPGPGKGLGLSIVAAGTLLLPYAVASVLGNRLALALTRVLAPSLVLPAGCAVFAAANLMLARWHGEPWQIVVALALGGIGSGFTFNAVPWLMASAVSAADTGSAMGLNLVLRFVGFAVGGALASVVIEGLADAGGAPTGEGFTAAFSVGSGVCLAAVAVSFWLLRGISDRPVDTLTDPARLRVTDAAET